MEQNLDTDFLHHFIQCYTSKASKYQSIPILSLQQPNPILKDVVRQHCIYYGVPSISLSKLLVKDKKAKNLISE
jgi:hypothetical protein